MSDDRHIRSTLNEAIRLLHGRRPANALRLLEPVMPKLRKEPDALRLYAIVLAEAGFNSKAISAIDKALKLRPMDPVLSVTRGNIFSQAGKLSEAVDAFRRCLAINPKHTEALAGLVRGLRQSQQHTEAVDAFLAAQAAGAPDDAFFASAAGEASLVRGDDRLEPDAAIDLQQRVLRSPDVPETLAADIAFQLGKLLERQSRHEEAFATFELANAKTSATFDHAGHRDATDRIIDSWNAETVAPIDGMPTDHLIFVVGMPRSGSTLIEQVLLAHDGVSSAGEPLELPAAARVMGAAKPPFAYVESPFDPVQASAAARRYLDAVRRRARSPIVIDKLLVNAFFVPFAATLFPNARFVGCLRDPRDVGLSCFQQSFGSTNPAMFDLEHIAHFQADTRRVMRHWQRVMPDRFTMIEYESVVADLEGGARAIAAAAGLEFDERSLRYWETANPISTASYDQASRPIYTTSVGRWRVYERQLAPLIETLKARGVSLPV
ncbi:MAG: sulfotransferase [Planctomycetota bacterium]